MSRLCRHLALLTFAGAWLLAGCGGTGTETVNTGAKASEDAKSPAGATQDQKNQSELVTPDRQVDTRQLSEVVKEEVKGGEATQGPSPSDYLWQPPQGTPPQEEVMTVAVPKGLPPLTPNAVVPAYNPLTKAKVELGKELYFDPRVSKNGTVSCATCHNPEKGWTDNLTVSVGILGQVGSRSAPTVLNTAYGKTMFWDGRAPSLEGQAQGPIQNKIEMGDQSYKEIVERLRAISGYREQFQKVFGTDVTLDGMAKAIAAFERTALSGNSAYDRYASGDMKALNESQKRGMVLFGLRLDGEDEFKTDVVLKKANCTSCHIGFNFSDEQFHNLGVGWNAKEGKFADLGRWAIAPIGAKNPGEIGAFKTPTLRDLTRTAPYMHDGSEATLEKVMELYDRGGNANPHLDKDMKKLDLTKSEQADVIEFLKALTGDEVKVVLPTLPVGTDGKSPNPRDALQMPEPKTAIDPVHLPVVR
jgi:cytochrome c peroxidase